VTEIVVIEGDADPSWGARSWIAQQGSREVGTASAWVRPDGKVSLSVRTDLPEARKALSTRVLAVMNQDCFVQVSAADPNVIGEWSALGFSEARREEVFVIAVAAAATALADTPRPPGVQVLRLAEVDDDRARLLDDELRNDVPGTAGWRWPVEMWRDELSSPAYDPELYVIAVDEGDGRYVGLMRAWNNPERPRLGMVGVVRDWRRRGLGAALLARVIGVLHDRGVEEVSTEVDVTNDASLALVRRMGGRVVGAYLELVRPA
jgi:GNAT superfamily N-acetyltransferase